jgi:hypothetical protein
MIEKWHLIYIYIYYKYIVFPRVSRGWVFFFFFPFLIVIIKKWRIEKMYVYGKTSCTMKQSV